jgi:hypothetical protein
MSSKAAYSKESVQFHREGMWGPGVPAVNVKMQRIDLRDVQLPLPEGSMDGVESHTDAAFTQDWIDANVNEEERGDIWSEACREGWEMLDSMAKEIWGQEAKVFSEGRSGGWATVDGIKEFEQWDAVDLSKWRRFEEYAKEVVQDIPHQMVMVIYLNMFENPEATLPSQG